MFGGFEGLLSTSLSASESRWGRFYGSSVKPTQLGTARGLLTSESTIHLVLEVDSGQLGFLVLLIILLIIKFRDSKPHECTVAY